MSQRDGDGFVVRRARFDAAGDTFEMNTPQGGLVLVMSELEGSRLDDAGVLTTVAASLMRAGASAGANVN